MTTRQKFNEVVKEYGNKALAIRLNYGLGDLFTEKVNFRRGLGLCTAVLGTPLIPILAFYGFCFADRDNPNMPRQVNNLKYPVLEIFLDGFLDGIDMFGAMGYTLGSRLDTLIGDTTSPYKKSNGHAATAIVLREYERNFDNLIDYVRGK